MLLNLYKKQPNTPRPRTGARPRGVWARGVVAGGYTNGVRAKFRTCIVIAGQIYVLNFDLTPFAYP
jgi:hypothetical protein